MDQVAIPFYTDMKFWSLIISILALVLSQWKFFFNALRRARLSVELYSQIFITHKYGNPNLQLHMILSNSGGRKVRIKGITAKLTPSTREKFSINATTYQKQGDPAQLLVAPFSLNPGEEWSHLVTFWNHLPRHIDKRIKDVRVILRQQINTKRELRSEEDKQQNKAVYADADVVAPLIALFEQQFKWHPDEYEVALSIETEPANAFKEHRFRFVLFESDTGEMRAVTENYAAGAGVLFVDETDQGTFVPIQEIKLDK